MFRSLGGFWSHFLVWGGSSFSSEGKKLAASECAQFHLRAVRTDSDKTGLRSLSSRSAHVRQSPESVCVVSSPQNENHSNVRIDFKSLYFLMNLKLVAFHQTRGQRLFTLIYGKCNWAADQKVKIENSEQINYRVRIYILYSPAHMRSFSQVFCPDWWRSTLGGRG